MSAEQRFLLGAMLAAGVAGLPVTAQAEEELPDVELLEYLGSWDGTDEDWVLLADEMEDPQAQADETRRDPAAEAEASQETDHES